MRKLRFLSLAVIVCAPLAALAAVDYGAPAKKPAAPPPPEAAAAAKTPAEAIANLANALENNNQNLFLQTVQFDPSADKSLQDAAFNMFRQADLLARDVAKTYGLDQARDIDPVPFREDLDKLRIDEHGERAVATLPEPVGRAIPLVKRDGAWKVDMTDVRGNQKEIAQRLNAMADVYANVHKSVGAQGIDASKIRDLLDEQMEKAMTSIHPAEK